ncbi:phospholipid scramblase 1-like [Alosa pseudoharengus]|uniref:phospholipid scramblase 1-like n=1 Tax=Alosa pseudoharengus TaxID=34774 RepID=UPI003F89A089
MASLEILSEGYTEAEPLIQMAPLDVHSQDDNDNNGPEAVAEEAVQTLQASNEGTVLDASKRASHCPPGLLSLNQIPYLVVQKESKDNGFTECFGGAIIYTYVVKDRTGQKMFRVTEDEDCCLQYYCTSGRSFTLHVTDITGREVITFIKPNVCNCGTVEVEIQCAPGIPIGYIISTSASRPKLTIQNERREPLLMMAIESCLPIRCCGGRFHLKITSLDGTIIGTISLVEDKTKYELQFPQDMDAKLKAIILGACVFIDIVFLGETESGMIWSVTKLFI